MHISIPKRQHKEACRSAEEVKCGAAETEDETLHFLSSPEQLLCGQRDETDAAHLKRL